MSYTIWDPPPSSGPSPKPSTGNGGGWGDLRERLARLETWADHHGRYTTDRLCAHHDRLAAGDQEIRRTAQQAMDAERLARTNETGLKALGATVIEIKQQMTVARAEANARSRSKANRRAARKEALVLMSYGVAMLTAIAALLGVVPKERIDAAKTAIGLRLE